MTTPFFGIGAMRAGSTWLHHVLGLHPDCAVSPIKELHFFDTKYGVSRGEFLYTTRARKLLQHSRMACEALESAIKEELGALEDLDDDRGRDTDDDVLPIEEGEPRPLWSDALRSRLFDRRRVARPFDRIAAYSDFFGIRDTDSYVAYLNRLSHGAAAYGEVTPGYALLPEAAFREMDSLFPGCKFLFMMRDPVDRLWSHVRKGTHRKGADHDSNADFHKFLAGLGQRRSTYPDTIARLEAAIPPERIVYLFYENATSPERGPAEIARLESALGLAPVTLDAKVFAKPKNAAKSLPLSAENEQAALKILEPVYRYIEARFGRIPGWRSIEPGVPSTPKRHTAPAEA